MSAAPARLGPHDPPARRTSIPEVGVLGLGSNLLVADTGVRGSVDTKELSEIELDRTIDWEQG